MDFHQCLFANSDWSGPNAPSKLQQARWIISNPRSLEKIRTMHEAARPDAWLLHNVFPVGSAAIYREALRLHVPIIHYAHNYRPFSINGYLWAGNKITTGPLPVRYLKEIRCAAWQNSHIKTAYFGGVLALSRSLGWWKSVRAWIAISEFVRQKLIGFGVRESEVFTLRHFWSPSRALPGPWQSRHYLFLGRLIEAKGLMPLVAAWELLERELGGAAPTLMIAGSGPLEPWIREKAGAIRSIEFVGRADGARKRALLGDARAVIVPSLWWEPLGLVVYEAYEAGKPVLAAASGGLSETVEHGHTGFLHAPGNSAELAAHVLKLESDLAGARQMGENGRRWLEANTGEARWRRDFMSILEHVIARSRLLRQPPGTAAAL